MDCLRSRATRCIRAPGLGLLGPCSESNRGSDPDFMISLAGFVTSVAGFDPKHGVGCHLQRMPVRTVRLALQPEDGFAV